MPFAMHNILYLHQGNKAGCLGRLLSKIDPDVNRFFGQGAVLSPAETPDILSSFYFLIWSRLSHGHQRQGQSPMSRTLDGMEQQGILGAVPSAPSDVNKLLWSCWGKKAVCAFIQWECVDCWANPRWLNKRLLHAFLLVQSGLQVAPISKFCFDSLKVVSMLAVTLGKGDFAGWIHNSHVCQRYFRGLRQSPPPPKPPIRAQRFSSLWSLHAAVWRDDTIRNCSILFPVWLPLTGLQGGGRDWVVAFTPSRCFSEAAAIYWKMYFCPFMVQPCW